MALLLQSYTFGKQYLDSWLHPAPQKNPNALKLGVLSTAQINSAAGKFTPFHCDTTGANEGIVIDPVATHPDVVLYAIASRDESTAASFASKYHFQKSYGSYEALLADPEVDFVYISTPNGLHFEWASKALDAGKHVLLEKPFTSNAIEAEALVQKSKQSGKILMEAFHWQFHPAAHLFRELLDSGDCPPGDIRWQFDLAGGSLMDMTYAISFTRYALHAETPEKVLSATAGPSSHDPRVDRSMTAALQFKLRNVNKNADNSNVDSTIYTDMSRSYLFGVIPRFWEFPSIRVETDRAEIYFYNAMMPHLYHYIGITDKETGKTRYVSLYKGGPLWKDRGETYWSTYRYQLEAFVDKIRGRKPVWWIEGEDSIAQMKTIDEVYKASGLPLRPTSPLLAA
ncbi:hypothetical protein D9613_013002 [Agrocybe pediades]|uniref:D-xylose 1-dehydrogenase (NADP(+), D-xylono-1,5-lactone-forming) n=1 Tax=Agrocybe pediades TaxID=84607 RepID=A0A8H4VMP0_9AGAR|nr:hypothetical protein D9613_013002 [Agrocybe pediades]